MFVEHFSQPYQPLVQGNGRSLTDPLLSLLTQNELTNYLNLVHYFQNSDDRNKRNLGLATFVKHLTMIHNFICRFDNRDNLRGLICGIQFGNASLLINTGRLKLLMSRSKSCMNGCFQKLGYTPTKACEELQGLINKITPGIRNEVMNPRKWCVRRAVHAKCAIFQPNIFTDLAFTTHEDAAASSPSSSEDDPKPGFSLEIMNLLNHH